MTHIHKPKQEAISNIHEYRSAAKSRLALAMTITGAVMILEVIGSILTGSLAFGGRRRSHVDTLVRTGNQLHRYCHSLQRTLPPPHIRILPR